MKEIRLHGRGGQGIAMSAEILAASLANDGKYVAGFPQFGGERRGAPVAAFVRFDDVLIREKTKVYFPDCLIVADASQLSSAETFAGLKPGGILVLNARELPKESPHQNVVKVATIDANRIAQEELGRQATNSCLLGAFAAATHWVTLESVLLGLRQGFEGELLRKNEKCAQRSFAEIQIREWH